MREGATEGSLPRPMAEVALDRPFLRLRGSRRLFHFLDLLYSSRGTVRRAFLRLQYALRLLRAGEPGGDFLERLGRSFRLTVLRERHPRFFLKPFRVYLHAHWSSRTRAVAAASALRFIDEFLTNPGRRAIFLDGNHPLAEWEAGGHKMAIRLTSEDRYEKEGEFLLQFLYDGQWLCALAFSITSSRSRSRVLYIGCLQSRNDATINDPIREATRLMHGLRPKALLFLAAQQMAQAWEAQSLLAVADGAHVHESYHFLFNRKRRKKTDYDEFWREMKGRAAGNGIYLFPKAFRPRAFDQIKPNKRSLYRNRYALLETLLPEMTRQARAIFLA